MSIKPTPRPRTIGCTICYNRKSTDEGIDQLCNSLASPSDVGEA